MGIEFKILSKFTEKQTKDIFNLLEHNPHFDKKYLFDNKLYWDFRHQENKAKMPDLTLTIEEDGIYICQNSSSNSWTYLETLKEFFEKEYIEHKIIDYPE